MPAAEPLPIRTLGDAARVQGALRGDAPAFEFEGRTTSFRAFDRQTSQVANGLLALGLTPGDRIAYLGKNSDACFEIWVGAAKADVVLAPVNWRLSPTEVRYILEDCEAKALFLGPEFLGLIEQVGELPSVDAVVLIEGEAPGAASYIAWRDGQALTDPHRDLDPESIALQLYTSGTTGHPKGAMLAHRALLEPRLLHRADGADWQRWDNDDVSLISMPVAHIGGSGTGVNGLLFGARAVIIREFDAEAVLHFLQHFSISKLFLVPSAMQIVARHPKARFADFSRMRNMSYGASPMPLDLLREVMATFGCGLSQMYGMTETTGSIVALPPKDHVPDGSVRMRSAGKPLAGVEVKVMGEDGLEAASGEIGEIVTRSAGNMSGYWRQPDATAAAIDPEGWLRTGDAGFIDGDGYLFIHDRLKDMIISGGENVSPAEVENAIFGHPGVAEVAVIGVPDPKWGEAVKAIVVKAPGHDPAPQEIIAWARGRIAGYKTPKTVSFIAALPRNASGKILKRQLREQFWVGVDRQVN